MKWGGWGEIVEQNSVPGNVVVYILIQTSYLFLATNSLPGCHTLSSTRIAYDHKGGVIHVPP